jgi:hypothetical protein
MGMNPRLLRPTASGFTPARIADLGLWLDASVTSSLTFNGSTVSEWRDLSGNGRHFAQATAGSQPTGDNRTLNGLRVLDFDGGDVLLGNAASLNIARNVGGVSVFFVAVEDNILSGQTLFQITIGGSTSTARFSFIPSGATLRMAARRLDLDAAAVITSSTRSTAPRVFSCIADYANASGFLYGEGSVAASSTSFTSAGNTSNTDSGAVAVGAQGSGGEPFDGGFGELVIYRRALPTAERQRVERYLGRKWNITVA